MKESISFSQEVAGLHALGLLTWAAGRFGDTVVNANSLGQEDQIIFAMIATAQIPIETFTLDTGRLFPETYDLIAETEKIYGRRIASLVPESKELEALIVRQGINGFYESKEARIACCQVRKIGPLRRALAGKKAWICGLRRGQSQARSHVERVSWDEANNLWRICPLADWEDAAVSEYVLKNRIPIHPLHAKGFPSIGCACCTQAVPAGGDPRSGRWWWEDDQRKECGLHWAKKSDLHKG